MLVAFAGVDSAQGEHRTSIDHEKLVYSSYRDQYGEEDSRTKESAEHLKKFTQNAVSQQKTQNALQAAAAAQVQAEEPVKQEPEQASKAPPRNKASKKNRQRAKKKQEELNEVETPPSDDDFILVSRKKHGVTSSYRSTRSK